MSRAVLKWKPIEKKLQGGGSLWRKLVQDQEKWNEIMMVAKTLR